MHAANAFNSLNGDAALRNVDVLCCSLAPFLINTYQNDVPMYIDGDVIFSKELGVHREIP